jgi:hypothetical protein
MAAADSVIVDIRALRRHRRRLPLSAQLCYLFTGRRCLQVGRALRVVRLILQCSLTQNKTAIPNSPRTVAGTESCMKRPSHARSTRNALPRTLQSIAPEPALAQFIRKARPLLPISQRSPKRRNRGALATAMTSACAPTKADRSTAIRYTCRRQGIVGPIAPNLLIVLALLPPKGLLKILCLLE